MEQPYYRDDGLSPNLAHTLNLPPEDCENPPGHYDAMRTGRDLVTNPIEFRVPPSQTIKRLPKVLSVLQRLCGLSKDWQ